MQRFELDRFSKDGPKWQKINIQKSNEFQEIISIFEKNGLINKKSFFEFYTIEGLEINSSNFLVLSNFKNFIAKRYPLSDNFLINSQAEIYRFIKDKQLSAPFIFEDRMPIINKETNMAMIFLDYKKGRYYKGSFHDMQKASISISNFIKYFQVFDGSKLSELEILQKDTKNIIKEFINQKKSWGVKLGTEVANLLEDEWKYIESCVNNSTRDIVRIKDTSKFALHIDLHPHNLLIHKDQCSILDIDSVRICHWPSAIGFSIFKLLRQSLTQTNFDKRFEKNAKKFICTITENIFEDISGDILFIGAKIEILRRILVILEGNQGENISPWNRVLKIQIMALRELNLIKDLLIQDSNKIF